jgi:type IV secretion system protein VirB10
MKAPQAGASTPAEEVVAERGVAAMARVRSLQSRLSSLLALLACAGLGVGLLVWYYGGMLAHRSPAAPRAAAPVVAAEGALPALGPIADPGTTRAAPGSGPPGPATSAAAPQLDPQPADAPPLQSAALAAASPSPSTASPQAPPDRRLTGPAFAAVSAQGAASSSVAGPGPDPAPEAADHTGALAGLLTPTALPPAQASTLATQRLLLAKGAFIDCTLETAIDSSLPGMTTCITATDTFGVDGKVVLLERGSKLIGETRGQVQQGSARLFVLWTEARTPTGVVVPLASPGTDALGRSGLDGEVDRHFWQRFGAAILISLVDGAAQAAQRSGGSGTVVYDPGSSRDVATEALRGTIGIAPTITKHQGDRIQVLVARDLDFRRVYQLRDAESAHQQ